MTQDERDGVNSVPSVNAGIEALRQNCGWLKVFAAQMTEKNWRDMKTRIGVQTIRLSDAIEALNKSPTLNNAHQGGSGDAARLAKLIGIVSDYINGPPGPHVMPEEYAAWQEVVYHQCGAPELQALHRDGENGS